MTAQTITSGSSAEPSSEVSQGPRRGLRQKPGRLGPGGGSSGSRGGAELHADPPPRGEIRSSSPSAPATKTSPVRGSTSTEFGWRTVG